MLRIKCSDVYSVPLFTRCLPLQVPHGFNQLLMLIYSTDCESLHIPAKFIDINITIFHKM